VGVGASMSFLVATDGSEEADSAVQYAAKQAALLNASVEIVHVLTPQAELVEGEIVLPGGAKAIETGTELLAAAADLAATVATTYDTDLTVETELLTGRPAAAITEYATESGVDAIYVGHRGLSEQQHAAVGSVAKSVVDRATTPVTIIK